MAKASLEDRVADLEAKVLYARHNCSACSHGKHRHHKSGKCKIKGCTCTAYKS